MVRVFTNLVWAPDQGRHQCRDVGAGQGDMRCAEGPDHVNAPGFQVCPGEHDDRRKVGQFALAQRRDLVLAAGVVPADPAAPPVGKRRVKRAASTRRSSSSPNVAAYDQHSVAGQRCLSNAW
jgi:hypothetical protein